MSHVIQHSGSKVWIEGVPEVRLNPIKSNGRFWDWTVHLKGLHSMLLHRGEHLNLAVVMGYSGDAFNLCHGDRWELRTGHAIPTDPLTNVSRALGYAGRWTLPEWTPVLLRQSMDDRLRATDHYLHTLWDEIDAGRPLLFGGAYGNCGTWRILVGYDLGAEQICIVGGEQPYEWTELWDEKAREWGFWDMQVRGAIRPGGFMGGWEANAAFLLGEKAAAVDPPEQMLRALRRTIELHKIAPQHTEAYGGVTYFFGEAAYQQWAKDLHELDYPSDLNKPRPPAPEIYDMGRLTYQASQIAYGRMAAAEFCRHAAAILPREAPYLLSAAEAYAAEAGIAEHKLGVFLDGSEEQQQAWLADRSQKAGGVQAIHDMLEKERRAIVEIERIVG